MFEIAILILLFFSAPYILIAVLWTRLTRLNRKLDETIAWAGTIEGKTARPAAESQSDVVEPVVEETPAQPEPIIEPVATPATRIVSEEVSKEVADDPVVTTKPPEEPEDLAEPDPEAEADVEPELEPEPANVAYAAAPSEAEAEVALEEDDAQDDFRSSFDFEDIFGRRLPIWAGGIALAIAGIFLVRYSIEAGLITPAVRVLLSFAFGVGLLAGAETAFRFEDKVEDPRVRQALAGAGIATLYGAFYLAGTSYGLIGAGAAFIGLAAVTTAAIALSFRFGLPCAILGLLGGFAAPLMVESDGANVPLLALYLALVTGGLAWTGVRQGRRWLGYTALAAGLGWGVLMQALGLGSSTDVVALGVYLVVLGTALPAFLYREGGPSLPQLAAAGIATLQMAVLVSNAGFDLLTWGQYLLISAALAVLGWRYPDLRAGSGVAALVGVFLLGLWWDAPPADFVIVAGSMALIFAGLPLVYLLRNEESLIETAMLAGVPTIVGAVAYLQFSNFDPDIVEGQLAAALATLAAFPVAGLIVRYLRTASQGESLSGRQDLPLLAASHGLTFGACLLVTPPWTAPLVAAALALIVIALLWRREDLVLLVASWTAAWACVVALGVTPDYQSEILRLLGQGPFDPIATAIVRWAFACAPFVALGAIRRTSITRPVADGFAALLAYGTAAQFVPAPALAWLGALGAIAIVSLRSDRIAGWATLLAVAGMWAIAPVLTWVTAGGMALSGVPFYVSEAVAPLDLGKLIAPFVAGVLVAAWRADGLPFTARNALLFAAGGFGMIALHSLFKQAFAIDSMLAFEHYGLAERTLWQAAFVGAALASSRMLPSTYAAQVRIALLMTSLLHFICFTLLLHNPLFTVQHVGPTPIANWLLAAYGSAIAAIALLREDAARVNRWARQTADIAIMALVCLLAVSLLRQVFAGTVLTSVLIGQTESLLLSLLGIALALGFLWWGSARRERVWRIGSLVLMLGAVCKVFLIDAAALSGLLRIASFMALGFSLIGIGWVYSRQLRRISEEIEPEPESRPAPT